MTKKKKILCITFIIVFALLYLLLRFSFVPPKALPSQKATSQVISENISSTDFSINFNSNEKNASLQIASENLATKESYNTFFRRTTTWFPIDSNAKYLTMYGGFNFAKWEFVDNNNTIIVKDHSKRTYNDSYQYQIENRALDTVEIPESATYARVTYINRFTFNPIDCLKFIMHKNFSTYKNKLTYYKILEQEPLYIVYGRFPSSDSLSDIQKICLPELNSDESILYKDNSWYINTNGQLKSLELDTPILSLGSTMTIVGDSTGTITIENKNLIIPEKNGIYGIEWEKDSTSIVGERVFDSKNFRFNYMIDESFAGIYNNDFDNIYPWSDIKLCSIDANGNVSYNVDTNSSDDIMVEIPAFYYSRTITDSKETILISAIPRDGFSIDPAFISPSGINKSIYVSAYQASLINKEIKSSSASTPLINLSYDQINTFLNEKGNNWDELDLVTLNAIQKLFLVETGVRNSQCLFTGNVASCFIWSSDNDPKYAQVSEKNTNTICIINDDYTQRFEIGDTVTIVTGSSWYDAYPYFTDNYINDDSNWNRTITNIQKEKKYLYISFSGDPIDIVENVSIIAHLPMENGKTDSLSYATGTYTGIYGKTAFKYRYLENLWGNICVILDNATVDSQNNITITYPDNSKKMLSFQSPVQKLSASLAHSNDCAVHSLGFDSANSAILYPETLKKGSLLTNSYGDWFMKIWREGSSQYITYGMTWDMDNYAGLFAYRVDPLNDTHKVENGARIVNAP